MSGSFLYFWHHKTLIKVITWNSLWGVISTSELRHMVKRWPVQRLNIMRTVLRIERTHTGLFEEPTQLTVQNVSHYCVERLDLLSCRLSLTHLFWVSSLPYIYCNLVLKNANFPLAPRLSAFLKYFRPEKSCIWHQLLSSALTVCYYRWSCQNKCVRRWERGYLNPLI